MYKVILFTFSLLTISACSEKAHTNVYSCDNKKMATIISHDAESATLHYINKRYQLTRQRSASGVKLNSEEVLFWTKANEAVLIIDGNKVHCNLK